MQIEDKKSGPQLFTDLTLFSKEVGDTDFGQDFESITKLNTSFLKSSERYLVINIKDYEDGESNNLLFLSEDKALLYSKKPPSEETFRAFQRLYGKPHGKTTVLTFLTISKSLVSYKSRLEVLINGMRELEQTFNAKKYRELSLEFERLYDRLEDFHDIVIKLEERSIKEVEIRYISFDYSVLVTESNGLLDRCRHRFNMLREIARDNEMQITTELNRRIEHLNDVVKKLTAITVALMIPNIIAGHFGMNFEFMPELHFPWAYPTVITAQIVITAIAILIFRKVRWL